MSLTKNMKRTGLAGAIEKREFLESLEEKYEWTPSEELELLIKMRDRQLYCARSYIGKNKAFVDFHIRSAYAFHGKVKELRKQIKSDYRESLLERKGRIELSLQSESFTPEQTQELNLELDELDKLIENI